MENLDDILNNIQGKSGPFELDFELRVNDEGLIYEIFVKDYRDGARREKIHSASIYPHCMSVEIQEVYKKRISKNQFPKNILLPFITRMEEEGYIIKE